MEKDKRERSANFTVSERDVLISLIQKYRHVLENKQSDGTTWKNKEIAWKSIEREFNARSGGVFRSLKTLKIKYDGIKRAVRKKSATIRSELYRTGGGINTAPPLDPIESQVKDMILLSVEGLESQFDSDELPQIQGTQDSIAENSGCTNTKFIAKNENLMSVQYDSLEKNVEDDKVIIISSFLSSEKGKEVCNIEELSPSLGGNTTENPLQDQDAADLEVKNSNHQICGVSTPVKWDASSRRKLKTRKHPLLSSITPHKSAMDDLTQAKLEVSSLQKQVLQLELSLKKKELEEKQKEWDFAAQERKWREQKIKIEIELLNKQLNK